MSPGPLKLDAPTILNALSSEYEDVWGAIGYIGRRAPTEEIVAALERAEDSSVRRLLCYMLGRRCDASAVPALISCLRDPVPVQARAWALGELGGEEVAAALEDALARQKDNCCTMKRIHEALERVREKENKHPRTDWEAQFQLMARCGDDRLVDPVTKSARFDEEEWEWS